MLLSLILGLLIGGLSVIFALQNVFPVTVNFLVWDLTASLAVIVSLSVVVGVIVSVLLSIPDALRNSVTIARLHKENKRLIDEAETARREKYNAQMYPSPSVVDVTLL